MKYLSFTFDDGRFDNYRFAAPILNKYGMRATVFCTSGYIDGTWRSSVGWKTAKEPVTVAQLKELQDKGWEIALHGDRHTTDVDDLRECIKKIDGWGLYKETYGFSLPNSNVDPNEIQRIIGSDYAQRIAYIRRGRTTDMSALKSKIEYALYTFLKIKTAYRAFNKYNVSNLSLAQKYALPSVVIKMSDSPDMIIDFIKKLPDNTHAILMLHSILPANHPYFGRDEYCFSTDSFEKLCKAVWAQRDKFRVDTVEKVLENYQ